MFIVNPEQIQSVITTPYRRTLLNVKYPQKSVLHIFDISLKSPGLSKTCQNIDENSQIPYFCASVIMDNYVNQGIKHCTYFYHNV
jgi:hypothetical protein